MPSFKKLSYIRSIWKLYLSEEVVEFVLVFEANIPTSPNEGAL